jgi:DNA helicase-2/ATP-dependent DNA helicase PcrA
VDPVAARADLDAFTDVADAFTGEGAEPTLGAFLAYLTAAQQEEFGLETGRVGESDSVKLLTAHAAKGLQWPAVFVPGLAVGERSQVFPARPRVSTRWTDNPRLIPFSLRGDAGDLPELLGLDAASLEAFGEACAARDLSEERRLMYVAATRAAFWLGCSGYWWGEGSSSRLGPSPFLEEVRKSGVAHVAAWADEPEPGAENPLLAAVEAADWPATPAGRRYEAVREAAALVETALAGGTTPPDPPAHGGAARPPMPPWRWPGTNWARKAISVSPSSRRCRSRTRSGWSTHPAPPACPSRSCTVTAASSWSTSRRSRSTRTCARATCSPGTPRPAG